jgi:hypothetical protein
MPIRPYLEGGVFDQEDIQTMSMALEEVCRVLGVGAGAAREREVVAIRIIELARRGELEYRRLVERVLKEAGVDWARPSLGMVSEVAAQSTATVPVFPDLPCFAADSSRLPDCATPRPAVPGQP